MQRIRALLVALIAGLVVFAGVATIESSSASAAVPGLDFTETGCEGDSDSVARLYAAGFGRVPDQAGFEYWLHHYTRGQVSLHQMAVLFTDSQEFTLTYGSLGTVDFVEQLYVNVLDRTGEAEGVEYWTGRIDDDGLDRGSVLLLFAESPENIIGTGTTFPTLGEFNSGRSGAFSCPTWESPLAGGTFTIVGDSVMVGATLRGYLTPTSFADWTGTVDARECRQAMVEARAGSCGSAEPIPSTHAVIQTLRAAGQLGDVVVLHVGTNGPITASEFDELMVATDGAQAVWIINAQTRWWEDQVNQVIAEGVVRWSETRGVGVLDWYGLSTAHPQYVASDGIHLTDAGARAYADMIRVALG